MRLQPLDFDVTQRRRGKDPAGQIERLPEIRLAPQFVNRRAAHHAVHAHLRADRRHQQRVAVLKVFQVAADAVQQQVVGVYFLDELPATEVAQMAQRPARR